MANATWLGGAATTTQISTMTLNNDFNDSETDITVTLTAEKASVTQTVSITPTGVDESVIAAALQVALAASTDTLFAAVTWTVATTVVTGTAKVAGVPFTFGSAVTGGAGTITDATGTANVGPHDWNSTANWSPAAVPGAADDVRITGTYDVLHGLNQASVALTSLSVGRDYSGAIGNSANTYYLAIDATTVTIEGTGSHYYINGTSTDVYVKRTSSSNNAVLLDGDIGTLHVNGPGVAGEVEVAGSAVLDNVYLINAPRARVTLGTSISSIDYIEMDGGQFDNSSGTDGASSIVRVLGGVYTQTAGALPGTAANTAGLYISNRATVKYNGDGTLEYFECSGTLDFTDSTADAVSVSPSTSGVLRAGQILLDSGMGNVTFGQAVNIKGGGTIRTEAGKTITP